MLRTYGAGRINWILQDMFYFHNFPPARNASQREADGDESDEE